MAVLVFLSFLMVTWLALDIVLHHRSGEGGIGDALAWEFVVQPAAILAVPLWLILAPLADRLPRAFRFAMVGPALLLGVLYLIGNKLL